MSLQNPAFFIAKNQYYKDAQHASVTVHQLFTGLFCSKFLFTRLLCNLKWLFPLIWLLNGAWVFLQDEPERVCVCMCVSSVISCFRLNWDNPCSASFFPVVLWCPPDRYYRPRHLLVHEESTWVFNILPNWQLRATGSNASWVFEFVFSLLSQISHWLGNKEKTWKDLVLPVHNFLSAACT